MSAGINEADTVHIIQEVLMPFLMCGDTETAHSGLGIAFLESIVSIVPSSLVSYQLKSNH